MALWEVTGGRTEPPRGKYEMPGDIGAALTLTTAAGAATAIGSVIGILVKRPGPKFMGATLGLAGGVLVYISFVSLLGGSIDKLGFALGNTAFFIGILAMFLLDYYVPHDYGAEHHGGGRQARLMRTGLFVGLGLALHNFPEGLATFAATLENRQLGIAIAFAIAVHNIPEGIAVAAPIYAATGKRAKAFGYSALSGLAEPVGAIFAAAVFYPFLSGPLMGWFMGGVAGLMVYIALDELIPASREYGHEHITIMSAVLGMVMIAASLRMLQ